MKSIFQMELEDKFNRKIKYREKKLKNQRMIIGKQQEEIERLNNIIKEVREYITKQVHRNQQFYEMDIENILEILDKEVN